MKQKIELLAPAKNCEIGKAAILHGADAVYIGAPKFGARHAAENSLEDIEELVNFAHLYDARVHVTLNTILYDDELQDVQDMIWDLYEIGVDVLIIQDMGLLKLNLPAIEMHASTQCDNRGVDKIKFMASVGFAQVVLARETSLKEMKTIHEAVPNLKLEAFVHGALCTSYSGQCYISESVAGRSANRGQCAQICRWPFSLYDAKGQEWLHDKYLLSLKDYNAADHLEEMLDAGITSLKIEGRLKDMAYVKNVVAYYREKLEAIFKKRPDEFMASSSGQTTLFFEPNPARTFNRGATTYFLEDRQNDMQNFLTPKSMGEFKGKIKSISNRFVVLDRTADFKNGDGITFYDHGVLAGTRVNRVDGPKLYLLRIPKFEIGQSIYRNHDASFDKQLAGRTAERKIALHVKLYTQKEPMTLGEKILLAKNSETYDLSDASGLIPKKKPKTLHHGSSEECSKNTSTTVSSSLNASTAASSTALLVSSPASSSVASSSATASSIASSSVASSVSLLDSSSTASSLSQTELFLELSDDYGHCYAKKLDLDLQVAKNIEKQKQSFENQFSKLGDTPYTLASLSFDMEPMIFVPISLLTELRRDAVAAFTKVRLADRPKPLALRTDEKRRYMIGSLDYKVNIANKNAEEFYLEHGVKSIAPAFELEPQDNSELMRSKYCLRFALGQCKKSFDAKQSEKMLHNGEVKLKDPLYICHEDHLFELVFDCEHCEMVVKKPLVIPEFAKDLHPNLASEAENNIAKD